MYFLCLFSIIVCCTNGANNPGCIIEKCGNLIDFKPSISYNDPATNGFVAGKYIDGSTIYAGQGDFNVCWWQVISLKHQKKWIKQKIIHRTRRPLEFRRVTRSQDLAHIQVVEEHCLQAKIMIKLVPNTSTIIQTSSGFQQLLINILLYRVSYAPFKGV